jgi:hypothetical protein
MRTELRSLTNLHSPMKLSSAIAVTATVSLSLTSCVQFGSAFGPTIDGKGAVTTDVRSVGTFNAVELEGSYDVVLTQSAGKSSITVHTNPNILQYLKTEIKNGKLIVSSDADLHPTERIKLEISSAEYTALDVDGSADVRATTPIEAKTLSLGLSGSGTYDLEVHATTLKSDVAGSGKLVLRGVVDTHNVDIAGSGDVMADKLQTQSSTIDVAGSGDATVYVKERLDASVAGSGNIRYKGGAKNIHTSISGSGSVNEMQ